jgi:Rho-binding antiterminator
MTHYQPINCEFHDVIEACATLRNTVSIVIRNADETELGIHAIVSDVSARDGIEYLKTQCGQVIRLDALVAVDGHEIRNFS